MTSGWGGTASKEAADVLPQLGRAAPGTRWPAWSEFMPELRQFIELNYVSMNIVLLVFGIVGLGIACAFVIFILRNIREHGILKAMGLRPTETAGVGDCSPWRPRRPASSAAPWQLSWWDG